MKRIILMALTAMLFAGCDSSTSTNSSTASTASINLTGRVRLDNASSGTIVATAGGLESALTKNADGSYGYTLVGNGRTTLARKASDTTVGYVYLVANDTDTLREIAIKSWSGTVPTNYVVQRNLSITVPSRFISDTVEAVFWSSDSVAYVLRAPRSSGVKHSTYIYTAYDSAAYYNGAYLFTAFARIKDTSGVIAYTKVFDTSYADGADLGTFDSTDFTTFNGVVKTIPGYTIIVNGAMIASYLTKSKSLDSTVAYDTITIDSSLHGVSWTRDSVHAIDGIKIVYDDTIDPDSNITNHVGDSLGYLRYSDAALIVNYDTSWTSSGYVVKNHDSTIVSFVPEADSTNASVWIGSYSWYSIMSIYAHVLTLTNGKTVQFKMPYLKSNSPGLVIPVRANHIKVRYVSKTTSYSYK
jgi:hypothetical protein